MLETQLAVWIYNHTCSGFIEQSQTVQASYGTGIKKSSSLRVTEVRGNLQRSNIPLYTSSSILKDGHAVYYTDNGQPLTTAGSTSIMP